MKTYNSNTLLRILMRLWSILRLFVYGERGVERNFSFREFEKPGQKRADLYLTFSLLHGLLDFNFTKFFELRADKSTRGHPFKSKTLNCFKKELGNVDLTSF